MDKKALVLLIGLFVCLTNGFAEEVPELILEVRIPESDAYIQGTEDIKRGPNSIFGEPDYEKMRDLPQNSQDYQLGRKVAYLFTPIEPGGFRGFICTGFLVGPDLLMTNHHCVHDDFGRPYPLKHIAVHMDYYQEPDVDLTRGGITAGVISIVKADARLDYALMRLDKPIGNTYGWLELDTTTPANPGQSVKIIHHSDGRSKEISRRNSEIVEIPADIAARNPFMIGYLADTEGGSSGSPIFLREETGVIGINHSSWFNKDGPIFNGGSLMSWIVPQIEQYLPRDGTPDLVVESARVDKEFLRPGESFTLSVTVRNQGTRTSPTTLRYYRSTDDTISMDDDTIGTDTVGSLSTGETVEKSITLTAPDYFGTHYYGACVDPAANETATYNNCAAAVSVNVSRTPPFWIYWGEPNIILRGTNDKTDLQAVVTGQNFPKSIALDVAGWKMYWTLLFEGKIQRANLDGSNVETLIYGLDRPHDIALDVASGKIYWSDPNGRRIQRANLDGSNIETLITGNATNIALDVAGGKIYYTTYADAIQRANLDGSNIETLIYGLDFPDDIALDVAGGKIYWADPVTSKIQRANLDGSNIEDVVVIRISNRGPHYIVSIALDVAGGKVYWANQRDRKIQRANLDGSHIEDLFIERPPLQSIALAIPEPSGPGPGPAPDPAPLDVNGDGQVNVMDLVAVALFYGIQVPNGLNIPADVNDDGVVDVLDLTAVAQGIDAAGGNIQGLSLEAVEAALVAAIEQTADVEGIAEAPIGFGTLQHVPSVAYRNVADALADARHFATGDVHAVLEGLLQLLAELGAIPSETALLPNYPNPFNPETWIPYHLATDAEVMLTIYDTRGIAVRALTLGHQPAGVYQSKHQAAYWDGKNDEGEKVSSGVYFYTLTAGDFTATRKLLIIK